MYCKCETEFIWQKQHLLGRRGDHLGQFVMIPANSPCSMNITHVVGNSKVIPSVQILPCDKTSCCFFVADFGSVPTSGHLAIWVWVCQFSVLLPMSPIHTYIPPHYHQAYCLFLCCTSITTSSTLHEEVCVQGVVFFAHFLGKDRGKTCIVAFMCFFSST